MGITPKLISEVDSFINQGNIQKAKERLKPHLKSAVNNDWVQFIMGTICLLENDLDAAENYLKKAIDINGKLINAYSNLGVVYERKKAPLDKVIGVFNRILEIEPLNFGALLNLGKCYINAGCSDEVHQVFNKMKSLEPKTVDQKGHYLSCVFTLRYHDILLGNIKELKSNGYDIEPYGVGAFPLFSAMRMYCLWESSREILGAVLNKLENNWKQIQLQPYAEVNLMLLAMPEVSHQQLLNLHKLAGKVAEKEKKRSAYTSYPKAMAPSRRWRIGILSPDFRKHIMDLYLRGIVTEHNRRFFEIICYSSTKYPDVITDIYKADADRFVDIKGLNDREVAEIMHEDGLHILLYATLYTVGGKTELIFYKPAPVQILYLGYPFTSGISEMDYFISDQYLDGPENAAYFVEKQLHLPEAYTAAGDYQDQVIADFPPYKENGYISFGSLIQPYKIHEKVIQVWAHILSAVPGSKMILNNPSYVLEEVVKNISEEFAKNGIDGDRLVFIHATHPSGSHLQYYNDIDMTLDAFPMTGGATTQDTLWMGVPVITLVGLVYHERGSYSMLKNAGLPLDDLIAFTLEEYIQKAIALAENKERIEYLRHAIPESLKGSILRDPLRLTRHLEAAFIEAWDRKFTSRPVNMAITESVNVYRLQEGSLLVTENCLEDVFNYVFQEQGQWYESEWLFLKKIVQPNMRVLDLGAGIGHYAIPLARCVGQGGKIWATTHCPYEAELIQASLDRNEGISLNLILKGDYKVRLDPLCVRNEVIEVDVMRIHSQYAKERLFKEGEQFFKDNNALIMFGIAKNSAGFFDLMFADALKERGYQLYRLVPGLEVLVPFIDISDLDHFTSNLFACKPERSKKLSGIGYLVELIPAKIHVPEVECVEWKAYLNGLPYTASHIQTWSETTIRPLNWEAYEAALNLYARTKDERFTLADRVASLYGALNVLLQVIQQELRFSRVVTLIRVLIDLGKREEAVNLLTQVCGTVDVSGVIVVDEPFIAVSDDVPVCSDLQQLGRAVFANLLLKREELRAFSTYFTGTESLTVLQAIEGVGLGHDVLRHRERLIRQRFAQ